MLSDLATEKLRERLSHWGDVPQKVFEAWVRELKDMALHEIATCFELAEKKYKERPSPHQFKALLPKKEKVIDRSVGLEYIHKMQEMGK